MTWPPPPREGPRSLPGGPPRLCSARPRRLRRGSSHRHLRPPPARWSRPGRPRALARKPEAGEARGEVEGTRAEVRAQGHRLPRARSSGRTKGRHWGRSPSASGPTWAPQPRSASRPPRPAHCAGAGGRQRLAGGEGGRTAAANREPVPPLARRGPSGHGQYPSTRCPEQESEAGKHTGRHAGGDARPSPTGPGLHFTDRTGGKRRPRPHARHASFCRQARGTGSGRGDLRALPATSGDEGQVSGGFPSASRRRATGRPRGCPARPCESQDELYARHRQPHRGHRQ